MGTRQRKDRKGGAAGNSDPRESKQQSQQAAVSDDCAPSKDQGPPQGFSMKPDLKDLGKRSTSTFAKAASLDLGGEDDGLIWSASKRSPLDVAVDQERLRKEKERKKAKREQERARGNREGFGKQKKGAKGLSMSGLQLKFPGWDVRSRLTTWLMYFFVAASILGIFVLRALEEYYSMDGDVSGEQRLQHLASLGLEDGALEADIKRAYRTLSIRWHPDRNPNCGTNCQQRFHEVATAYEFLMRQQRREKTGEEGVDMRSEGAEFFDGSEGLTGVKVTSQGIADFSSLGPHEVFLPTADTKNVWSIMIHQDTDDWSKSVYEIWQESYRALGKYVKFGVIIIRGRSGKDVLKRLPINVKIFPAILLLTAGMHPEQYPNIMRPSVESLNRFIADAFPSSVDIVESAHALRSWLASPPSSSQPLAAQYKAVLIPSAGSASKPSLLVKHAAFVNKQLMSFCFLANARSVLSREKEAVIAVLKDPPAWITPISAQPTASSALKLPVHMNDLQEEALEQGSNLLLFMDEGRGVSRVQAVLHTVRSKLLNPATSLSLAIDRFKEALQPLLYQQNSASLCKSSLQRQVFCLVVLEPAEDVSRSDSPEGSTNQTLDLERMKALLQLSKKKYLLVQTAKMHEKPHAQKDAEDADETSTSTNEPEDVHIVQPDNTEEDVIHIQVVRVSVGKPAAAQSLPGLPKESLLLRMVKEELDDTPVFLLDLESSRVAALPPLYVEETGKANESKENVYKRLYQALEDLKSATDDEEETGLLSFSPLPEYCSGQNFARQCLASVQNSWWMLLSAGWWLQILLLLCIGIATFMFWNKITAEMFLCGMVLLSLGIGAWSAIQPLVGYVFRNI
ncbi:putative DnaJ domain-containing protein [Cyclospora cayetanensis]|uniref:DnaJ domain-containing protein n=1 Tax=Cyclospora cayetanensis TaxID=88456 RepID=A0A1D3CVA5_9EIME|nr:putative DnaJ domain-containing protein [Cyclospora cayetanensis]